MASGEERVVGGGVWRVLGLGVVGGAVAAVVVPVDRAGVGWFVAAAVVLGLVRRVRVGWAALALGLFAMGGVIGAPWVWWPCAVAGCAAVSLAVAGGWTGLGVLRGAVAVPLAAGRAVPWVRDGVRGGMAPGVARSVLVTLVVLGVFVPLFAGADAAFAGLLGDLLPDGAGLLSVAVFVVVGLGTVGACLLVERPVVDVARPVGTRFARRDWVLPVWALVVLFAVFVAVQATTSFGGNRHVLETAGLTYAEYARTGFWQLLVVTVLTLGIIGVVARHAEDADRRMAHGLLGGLAVLTLVIVASALSRMWTYQQVYGFTVLRVLVIACELWLGVVYLLLLAAGATGGARWVPRAVVATGFGVLLGLAVLNPDRFIADRNIDRWERAGQLDVWYLHELSDDAVPAFDRLPEGLRGCALMGRERADDGWRSWNLGRVLAQPRLRPIPCEP
ncbi:DUF4173 domain-containing protein [Actinosynnema sp. NPDC020468]|uniref:DUF4153 domain-containing protein n=1 Tax=Actinosynnema sp. NPDC020468 TaxID=3154488 RepID=UPI0033D39A20